MGSSTGQEQRPRNVSFRSFSTETDCLRHVRSAHVSDRIADIAEGPVGARGASLRPSQVPAQDSAERLLPKRGRQAWEVKEELQEALLEVLEPVPEGRLLFATHG